MGVLYSGKTGRLQVSSNRRLLAQEARGGVTRSSVFYVIGYRYILGFLWFVLSWEWEQNLGKLSVTNQVDI